MGQEIDFEAEGLLRGTRGRARQARRELLERLAAEGATLEELRRAVAEDRLALLPAERELAGDTRRLTADEVAELTGIEREFLDRQWRALGMAIPAEDEAAFTERDVEAARRLAALRGAGLPDEGILEVGRLLGMTMSQLAAANRRLIGEAFVRPGDTEREVAERFATAARELAPMLAEALGYTLNLHLREQLRHDAVDLGALRSGRVAGAEGIAVSFVDMVGFTQLGETLPPEDLGEVTGRLAGLVTDSVRTPVRVVKLIGDAAMLVAPEPEPVLEVSLELVAAAARIGDEFPLLRAGVATGSALPRAGDWYGRPVNLASRITGVARPGSVLADEAVRRAADGDFAWSFAGARRLKGITGNVRLYRCRRAGGERAPAEEQKPEAEPATGRRRPRRRRARPS